MDISDGHTPGPSWLGRQAPTPVPDPAEPGMTREGEADGSAEGAPRGAPIHPRLLAMMMAARYFGLELDPHKPINEEFGHGESHAPPG